MIKRGLRRRTIAAWSAIAAVLLLGFATSPAASADTMRTFKLAFSCDSGLPYGLSVNNGSGWYEPNGSSYVSGGVKYFTVSIPASASTLAINSVDWCDGQAQQAFWEGSYYSITPGTSTISANGDCQDNYYYYGTYLRYCSISSITYG